MSDMNKKLQDSLKVFDKISKNDNVTGYFLVSVSQNEDENKGFYYTFNGQDVFELLGLVSTVQDMLKQYANDQLSDDTLIENVPEANCKVNSKLQ